jgi:hypothetical protein
VHVNGVGCDVFWHLDPLPVEMTMSEYSALLQYGCDCDGLVAAVTSAAVPYADDFAAYKGSKTEYAVLFAKLVMRKARTLGLYTDERVFPKCSPSQQARETRGAA